MIATHWIDIWCPKHPTLYLAHYYFMLFPLRMTSISLAFYITSKHLIGEVKNGTKGQNGKTQAFLDIQKKTQGEKLKTPA